MQRHTVIGIQDTGFTVNGTPTLAGRSLGGVPLEGLLLNARFVQAIFDDLNPDTRPRWALPDGTPWDAERNTDAFIAQLLVWRRDGLHAFTLNLQGGSPEGYSRGQPWENSAFDPHGNLRPAYMQRLERILDRADQLGFVAILGLFYFGQDSRVLSEEGIIRGTDLAVDWLLERKYSNVLIEIANECDINDAEAIYKIGVNGSFSYEHPILCAPRAHELIQRVQHRSSGRVSNGHGRLLVSTSYRGGGVLRENVARVTDFVLLHGNSVETTAALNEMIERSRACPGYHGQPITINEDDHYAFASDDSYFLTALRARVGWGFFDFRQRDEGFNEGYQTVPVDWRTNSQRKRDFFRMVRNVSGLADADT